MNFSAIAGGGGGPGGSPGTDGPVVGAATLAGGSGTAFGLNRNTFRSASSSFGRSMPSLRRWTSGAPPLAALIAARFALAGLRPAGPPLDVGAVVTDVVDQARYITAARATARHVSRICLRRSD